MRLADAPDNGDADGVTVTFPRALLRNDHRLEALFAPFGDCVVLHETLLREGGAGRATRLLMAESRGDRYEGVCALVHDTCPQDLFESKPTELDDVAAGTEWRERSGTLLVSAYRLFGGSTALRVTSVKVDDAEAPMQALRASPLAILAELVEATSVVENVSCSRNAKEPPRWHLQAALRDLRRFDELAPQLLALGFDSRRGKYWHDQTIVQPVGKNRWMAALPGINFDPQ